MATEAIIMCVLFALLWIISASMLILIIYDEIKRRKIMKRKYDTKNNGMYDRLEDAIEKVVMDNSKRWDALEKKYPGECVTECRKTCNHYQRGFIKLYKLHFRSFIRGIHDEL